jgi:hypothetical protein
MRLTALGPTKAQLQGKLSGKGNPTLRLSTAKQPNGRENTTLELEAAGLAL